MNSNVFHENGVTAHRGDSTNFPQNTLRAFSAAIELGADWIETDVHMTKDGQLVLMHNPTTGDYCEKDVAIRDCTYAELAGLDAAWAFRKSRGLTLEQCPWAAIPLLSEALDIVLAAKKSKISLQPKCDCVDRIVELVNAKGAREWIGFNDSTDSWMARARELAPFAPIFYDRCGDFDLERDIDFARRHGFNAIVPHYKDVTPKCVAHIQEAGLKVGAWTVNDSAEMRRFIDMGIDRIYTDDPTVLMNLK